MNELKTVCRKSVYYYIRDKIFRQAENFASVGKNFT